MGNGEKYSLRGLNAVFAGLLLTLLVAIVGALANGMILINFGENEIGFYVRIGTSVFLGLGYILVMAGTHSARKHSEKFAKACKYCIFEFVADIILGAILLGTFMYNIGGAARDITNVGSSKLLAIFGFAAVFVLMIWIFRILTVKNLMGGCADVASAHEDRAYSRKCTATWVIYILLNIVILIGSVTLAAFFYNLAKDRWAGFGESINTLQKLLGLGINEIYTIVTLIAAFALLNFIIVLVIAFRVRGTYSRFHGNAAPVKYAQADMGKRSWENGENSSPSNIEPKTLSTLNPFSGERANGETSPLDTIQKSNRNPKLSDTVVVMPKKKENNIKGESASEPTQKPGMEKKLAMPEPQKEKKRMTGEMKNEKISVAEPGKELSSVAIDKLFEEALNNETGIDLDRDETGKEE